MNPIILLSLVLVCVFVCIILMGFVLYYRKQGQLYHIQEEEISQYALEVEHIYQQMRAIRHDYLNHLQVMKAYLDQEKTEDLSDYVASLVNEMNQVDTIVRSGNTLIDALVNTKLTLARKKGIQIDATVIAPNDLPIQPMDVSIILGNLLTNAVEAAEKVDHGFIRLYIAPIRGNFYLSITNAMKESPRKNFLSLKGPNRQGYGIHRIDQTVGKYHGIVNRQFEEGVFATEITLPLE